MIYYNSLNTYLKNTFHEKIYKLSLTSSCSCPNRENGEGCIFCLDGSSAFSPPYKMPLSDQIEFAKNKIKGKTKAEKFIAYFGNYTSTYGDTEYQRELFLEAAKRDDIAVVSIATRPDCISEKVMDTFREIKKYKPLWVELGLQTVSDKTAELIMRGYKTAVFDSAVKKLKAEGITVIAHMIIGLPGETTSDAVNTVRHIGKVGCDGIKLQLLHIIKGTKLHKMYESGLIDTLTFPEYLHTLTECVKALPEDITVHRLTGDGPRKDLAAPLWSTDKKRVLNEIKKIMVPK